MIDADLIEQQSCRISSLSDLKRRNHLAFLKRLPQQEQQQEEEEQDK